MNFFCKDFSGCFICKSGKEIDTHILDEKLERFKKAFEDLVNKYSNGEPTQEVIELQNEIIENVGDYLKSTIKSDKLILKEKILSNLKNLNTLLIKIRKN